MKNIGLWVSIILMATAPINLSLFFLSGIVTRIGDWALLIGLIPPICGVSLLFGVLYLPRSNTLPITGKPNGDNVK